MSSDPVELPHYQTPRRQSLMRLSPNSAPAALLDEIAQEEWERVSSVLHKPGPISFAHRTLLVGYCNAVARAIRAEQVLAVEGRYYATTTKRGSLMHRRHPAVQDAERGWTAARHLAKQLGITGGLLGEQQSSGPRRSVFK